MERYDEYLKLAKSLILFVIGFIFLVISATSESSSLLVIGLFFIIFSFYYLIFCGEHQGPLIIGGNDLGRDVESYSPINYNYRVPLNESYYSSRTIRTAREPIIEDPLRI